MDVIHFTHGATDPLQGFGATGAGFPSGRQRRQLPYQLTPPRNKRKGLISFADPRRRVALRPRTHHRDNSPIEN
jgi:hypothetical protein